MNIIHATPYIAYNGKNTFILNHVNKSINAVIAATIMNIISKINPILL